MPRRRDAGSSLSGLIPRTEYHSAHKPPLDDVPPLSHWRGDRVIAFVHDLMSTPTLPGRFDRCEVLVADLPWERGFDTFNRRAGLLDRRTYPEFMARVAEIVDAHPAPTYLITGRHALRSLPTPDAVLPMLLNEHEAVAIGYRCGLEAGDDYHSAPEFLVALANLYSSAGDFACGYGRTGRVFVRAGKSAVLSDVNPRCIGYIADQAPVWAAS